MEIKPKLVAVEEAHRFMMDCFMAIKVPKDHAKQQADVLIAADYRGLFSHGMNRLEMYINNLSKQLTNGSSEPKLLSETPATAWVDGCNALGAVVGNYCMDLAIKKAKEIGVGWVCAKGSNHYGMAGWYPLRAMHQGVIGITMTNTPPFMAPTRSNVPTLGTNPLAVGALGNDDKFLLDMATTAVSVGKIEMQRRKGEPLPNDWALGPDGKVTNDADIAYATGCLMPLGGTELNAGYKGYGLAAMVEILCGIMAGANYLTDIPKWIQVDAGKLSNLGQVFIAVDPNCFAPDFEERLSDMTARLRLCKPIDPTHPVLIPGEKEDVNMNSVDAAGGIQYLENQLKACEALAKRLNVKPLTFV